MPIDVSKFHQTFFEESLEGLEAMETGLLELEEAADDEAMNTIFRAAHSIKGGAGTLGFSAIADFTHHVETILDRRRAGTGEVTQETIDVLLASVDCLRDMLAAAQDGDEFDTDRVAEVETRLQQLLDRDTPGADGATHPPTPMVDETTSSDEPAVGAAVPDAAEGWRISFAPHADMLRTGNDPVRILGELADLGEYRVTADLSALPELETLDVEVCYAVWSIEVEPSAGGPAVERSAVERVFDWVEDEADIHVEPIAPRPEVTAEPEDEPYAAASSPDQAVGANEATKPAPSPERRSGSDRRQDRGGPPTSNSMRVDIEKVDTLINMVGELVITQSMLQQLATAGEDLDLERLREGLTELEAHTRELQGSVMQIRMLPISFAFSRLPRLVRDLASKLGKSVELEIHGETTELDKTVMEKIGDPLVHLIRNSLDHGIEPPEVRAAAGKPRTGTVIVSAYHEGGNIVVEISDDGGGIRADKILAKARERGLVGADEPLVDSKIHDLIFHPGLSTAEEVSDVSGRGVGMDVVRRNINDLGGAIEVVSADGVGTTFRIRLPLTLAILDGQVVRVGDQVFIIPLISIVESLQFDSSLTGDLTRNAAVYRHRDRVIPLVHLREVLGVTGHPPHDSEPLLVVVEVEGGRAGLLVDDLLAQQQIVIKSLTTNFRAVRGLSGATILGDGTVAMILDVNSLLGLFQQSTPHRGQAAARAAAHS